MDYFSPNEYIIGGISISGIKYLDENILVQISGLKVGDELVVHIDGLEEPLTGQLRWIATEPAFTPYYALNQEERARLMYLAEVQLPDSQAHLPNGVPAQVELP